MNWYKLSQIENNTEMPGGNNWWQQYYTQLFTHLIRDLSPPLSSWQAENIIEKWNSYAEGEMKLNKDPHAVADEIFNKYNQQNIVNKRKRYELV